MLEYIDISDVCDFSLILFYNYFLDNLNPFTSMLFSIFFELYL